MKIIDCVQKSDEWFQARLVIPTTSRFSDIVTSKGEPSKSATKYIDELLAEWIAGKPIDQRNPTQWMEHGTETEAEARKTYEFIACETVLEVGFCTSDDGSVGCSPDGLIREDGGLEIKCPMGKTLIEYYRTGFPSGYKAQVQGSLWITGREWWDFMAYHEEMTSFIVRVEPDEVFIKKLSEQMEIFNAKLEAQKKLLEGWKIEKTL